MCKWLRLAAAAAFCASGGWAVDWTALKPQGYVSDFAAVVNPAARARLDRYCAAVERASGAQIALITIQSLEGEPVDDVARSIFQTWGVRGEARDHGVLLVLAIGDHRSYLVAGSGLQSALPGDLSAGVLREMGPALRRKDYTDALAAAADTIGAAIALATHTAAVQPLPRRAHRALADFLPWPLLVGSAVLLVWLFRSGAPRGYGGFGGGGLLPALILGNRMGRGAWGCRSSGGFGGYDSGDSFGGFGGGDAGRGRAASDW
jgi:uncharacterized protein